MNINCVIRVQFVRLGRKRKTKQNKKRTHSPWDEKKEKKKNNNLNPE